MNVTPVCPGATPDYPSRRQFLSAKKAAGIALLGAFAAGTQAGGVRTAGVPVRLPGKPAGTNIVCQTNLPAVESQARLRGDVMEVPLLGVTRAVPTNAPAATNTAPAKLPGEPPASPK